MVRLSGYYTTPAGKTVFYEAGSWSERWGVRGFAEIPEEDVARWSNVYGLNIKRAA